MSLYAVLLPMVVFGQTALDEFYLKIEKKLAVDKKYLNIYALPFQPSAEEAASLSNIAKVGGTSVSLINKENVTYQLIFLKENFELDSLVLLGVKKIEDKAGAQESFFGGTSGPQVDTSTILSFRDMQELYFQNKSAYWALYSIITKKLGQEDATSLLGLKLMDKASKSKGITSLDNTDFLLFEKANFIHRYPKLSDETRKAAGARRRGAVVEESSSESEFSIDASLSHVSFFHKSMDFGFSQLSAEINTGTKALNLVPWSSMSLAVGVRSLFSVPAVPNIQNLKKDFIIDARIMGRARVNTSKFIGSIPFVFGAKPTLNVGSGLILDVQATRAYEMPFLNLYFAFGSEDVSKPYVKQGTTDTSRAFFTFKQWETSLSFYWNSGEDRTVRYKMDIGMGNYNIFQADYIGQNQPLSKMIYNKIKPIVGLNISFAPQRVDFLSAGVKFYDNKLTLNFWLKMMEFSQDHVIRLETMYISAPMFRSPYPWESNDGNSIVQIRYRYAM